MAESDPDPAESCADTDKVLPDASGVRVRCSCRHSEKDTAIPVVLIVLCILIDITSVGKAAI